MTKVGRNDPCPCGSGKKYKHCCLPLHDAASQERKRLLEQPVPVEQFEAELNQLDELSNRVEDLIRQGSLEQAERLAHELLRRFPDQLDGLESLARVLDARGDIAKAAEYYKKAALFAEQGDGYDPLLIADLRRRAAELDLAHPNRDGSSPPSPEEED